MQKRVIRNSTIIRDQLPTFGNNYSKATKCSTTQKVISPPNRKAKFTRSHGRFRFTFGIEMSDGEEHDDPLEEEDEYSPELPRKQHLRVDDDDDSSENAEWEPDYENAIRDAIKHKDVEVFKAIHGR